MICLISAETVCKDLAVRGPLMIIKKVITSTCTEADDYTSDEKISNTLLSNVTLNVSGIFNSETRYVNVKSKKTK